MMGNSRIRRMECVARKDQWPIEHGVAQSAPAGFLYPGCRRAASFPFVADKEREPTSALKVRSQSESEGLNRCRAPMSIEQFRQKIRLVPTREEESGCDTETDSETLSQSGSSTNDLEDLATETEEIPCHVPCRKKSVRFADDCGHDLYCVKVMTEPSDCPPLISPAVLRRFRGDSWDDEEDTTKEATWTLSFPQPASDYIKFREAIEKNKVSLENIVLRNDQLRMTGTVKVANIAFEKRVFLRWTSNGWATYLDRPATYQGVNGSRVFDTFTFNIEIPQDTDPDSKVEFCVCYVAGDKEYWDSNGGANYALISTARKLTHVSPHPNAHHSPLFGSFRDRDDAYNQRCENWSSFASWRNLSVEGPYW